MPSIATFSEGLAESGETLRLADMAVPALEQALARALEQGRVAWPHLTLDAEIYCRHLGRCVASMGNARDTVAVLNELAITDLFLACAAGHGDAAAIEVISGYVETTVRQIGPVRSSTHDIAQILRQRLCVADDDRPAKILTYLGRAPLEAWLAAVAQRTAVSLSRTDGAQHRMRQRLAAETAIASQNPELQLIKSQYEGEFKEALRRALEDLSDRWRTLLRLHVFAGQTLDHLAIVYDVHDTTISRWLAKAQQELLERTAHHMHHQFGVNLDEFPSLVRVMASQIDVSIARLLDEERTPMPKSKKGS